MSTKYDLLQRKARLAQAKADILQRMAHHRQYMPSSVPHDEWALADLEKQVAQIEIELARIALDE